MRAEGTIQAEIWPEGLSAAGPNVNNGALTVLTEQTATKAIPRTLFTLTLAWLDTSENPPTVKAEPVGKTTTHFGTMQNTEAHGHLLTDNFRYEIELPENGESDCAIQPKNTLPVLKEPYDAMLPISAEAGSQTYELKLPLRLTGDTPARPMDWQTEVDKLKKTVAEFGLSQKPWEREFFHNIRHRTPNEISMVRYAIISDARDYYEKDAMELAELGNRLARTENLLKFLEWMGDQACTYLAGVYKVPTLGAFLNPLKKWLLRFLGEYGGAMLAGEDFKFDGGELHKSILESCQEAIAAALTKKDAVDVLTPNQIGNYIAGFIIISFGRHYLYGESEKRDIYKSLVAAVSDLGGVALKEFVGTCFKHYVSTHKDFCTKVGEWMQARFFYVMPKVHKSGAIAEAIEHYVKETCGFVHAELTPYTPLSQPTIRFEENSWVIIEGFGGFTIKISLIQDIANIIEKFYEWALKTFYEDAQKVHLSPDDYLVHKGYGSDGTRGGEALDPHGMDSTRPTMDIGTDVHGGGYMR